MIDGEKEFKSLFEQKNRFNSSLFSCANKSEASTTDHTSYDSLKERPAPLFGAMQRLKPGTGLANPFNVNFEIPPLPNLDFFGNGGGLNGKAAEYNFFSMLGNKHSSHLPKESHEVIRSPDKRPEKVFR